MAPGEHCDVARRVAVIVLEDRLVLQKEIARLLKEVPEVEEHVLADEALNELGERHFDAAEALIPPADRVALPNRSVGVLEELVLALELLRKAEEGGSLQGEVLKEQEECCTHDHVRDKNGDVEEHPPEQYTKKCVVHLLDNSKQQ